MRLSYRNQAYNGNMSTRVRLNSILLHLLALGALVMLSAILVMGGRRWTLITAVVLLLPVVLVELLPVFQFDTQDVPPSVAAR